MASNLLVVEDDTVFRESLQRHLGDRYTLYFADTLGAARSLVGQNSYVCVLLDFRLPDGEGTSLIQELVAAELPVIVCTGRGSESVAVKALREGAEDYLAKSEIRKNDLQRAIDNAIERSQLRATVRRRDLEKDDLITQLQTALKDIETLRGMIPICATCKKIRDDEGYWHGVETYVSQHTQASFTHGSCPECLKKALDEIENM